LGPKNDASHQELNAKVEAINAPSNAEAAGSFTDAELRGQNGRVRSEFQERLSLVHQWSGV